MRDTFPTSASTSGRKAHFAEDSKSRRVFVGLSGGVDSAVSAALLKQEGYDITGVFIKIQIPGYPCPAAQDRLDAMRVAAHLRVPFVEIDLSEEYEQEVFRPSIEGFAHGETPNPDTLCNQKIKFGVFYDWARARGADHLATGHYAQIKKGLLFAGTDSEKDQSYFLWMVPQEVLQHVLFPIGSKTKKEVRALAKTFNLPNAERRDSQGLCFLGNISVGDMLARELSLEPGRVLNEAGEVVGTHHGAARYTLGQRHGFVLTATAPDTQPHFVTTKDTTHNTITVSTEKFPHDAHETGITLKDTNWIGEVPDGAYGARYRYRQALIAAEKKSKTVRLCEPHYAPPGQSLVLYDGERCVGGGIIDRTWLS